MPSLLSRMAKAERKTGGLSIALYFKICPLLHPPFAFARSAGYLDGFTFI